MIKVKKIVLFTLLIFMVVALCSCSGKPASETPSSGGTSLQETTELNKDIEIIFSKENVADPDAFVTEMKGYGAEVSENAEENTIVLVFDEAEHKKLLKDKYDATLNAFKNAEENEELFIEKIEYDEDFRNLKMYVNREQYDSTSSTINEYLVAANAIAYQSFLPEGQDCYTEIIYSDNDEVATTFSMPIK